GELTLGSLSSGVDLVHAARCAAFGSRLKLNRVPTLNAPRPGSSSRSAVGVGDATKWSWPLCAHSTAGAAAPALPSVQPVRCGLPRYVDHGSAAMLRMAKAARSVFFTGRFLVFFGLG